MYVVFLAGGIASGKSTVLRELGRRGAACVDLDALSREVTQAGSPTNERLAKVFGTDVLGDDGTLRRATLARRAFASPENTRLLESIMHPAIRERMRLWLADQDDSALCVVEIPLLDRVEDLIPMADDVLCVVSSLQTRRVRAIERGMTGEDFDARVAQQTSDDYLVRHATTIFYNDGSRQDLIDCIDSWWEAHADARTHPLANRNGRESNGYEKRSLF